MTKTATDEIKIAHLRTVTKALPIGGPNNVLDRITARTGDGPGADIAFIPSERRFRITTVASGRPDQVIYLHETRVEIYEQASLQQEVKGVVAAPAR